MNQYAPNPAANMSYGIAPLVDRDALFADRALHWVWNMPSGLPQCVSLKWLSSKLINECGAYSRLKNEKKFKDMRAVIKKAHPKYLATFPIDLDQVERLNEREKYLSFFLSFLNDRQRFSSSEAKKGFAMSIPSNALINRYVSKRHGYDYLVMPEEGAGLCVKNNRFVTTREFGVVSLLTLALSASGARMVSTQMGDEGVDIDNLYNFLVPRKLALDGIVEDAVHDVLEDNKYASRAGAFIFAVCDMLNSGLLIDFFYKTHHWAFEKHFSVLRSCPNPEYDKFLDRFEKTAFEDISSLPEPPPGYVSPGIDFSAFSFKQRVRQGACSAIFDDAHQYLSMFHERFVLPDNVRKITAGNIDLDWGGSELCDVIKNRVDLADRTLNASMKNDLIYLLASLKEMLSQAQQDCAELHEGADTPQGERVALIGDTLGRIHCGVESLAGLDADDFKCVSDTLHRQLICCFEILDRINRLAKDHVAQLSTIKETIEELANKDPIGNRKAIQQHYARLDEPIDPAFGEAIDELEALALEAEHHLDEYAVPAGSASDDESDIDITDGSGAPAESDPDYDVLSGLAESLEDQTRELERELAVSKSRQMALEYALNDKKHQYASASISDPVRAILQKAFTEPKSLNVEQALSCVHALYPDVEILPDAWSSAQNMEQFERCDTLLSYLNILCGPYKEMVLSGSPDTQARECFPPNVFAANESDTVASGDTRKRREFVYNGETVFFSKHLRIGVSDSERHTVRVHFDIIEGVLVIAFCGRHLPIR